MAARRTFACRSEKQAVSRTLWKWAVFISLAYRPAAGPRLAYGCRPRLKESWLGNVTSCLNNCFGSLRCLNWIYHQGLDRLRGAQLQSASFWTSTSVISLRWMCRLCHPLGRLGWRVLPEWNLRHKNKLGIQGTKELRNRILCSHPWCPGSHAACSWW